MDRARQKRFRKRLCAGITVVKLEVDSTLLNTLLRLHYLREQDAQDKAAIAKAIEQMHRSISIT